MTETSNATSYRELIELLTGLESALVAFSGGVDSTLLLFAAREALGGRVLAVVARSPIYPAGEDLLALERAREMGVEVRAFDSPVLEDDRFCENSSERCYLCKRALLAELTRLARVEGMAWVIEGSNADDRQDYRPGSRAVAELGVRSPLAEIGLTKQMIRALAEERGLAAWDKPALACLASRLPYGVTITEVALSRIDRAERAVRGLGLAQVRVRDHGEVARVEVDPSEIPRILEEEVRRGLVEALKAAGYRYVSLDLEGYRTGSMNETLDER